MKRTAQRFDKPGQNIPEHTSGCRQFEGEDLRKLFQTDQFRSGHVEDREV